LGDDGGILILFLLDLIGIVCPCPAETMVLILSHLDLILVVFGVFE
jgi:hypothetical protein